MADSKCETCHSVNNKIVSDLTAVKESLLSLQEDFRNKDKLISQLIDILTKSELDLKGQVATLKKPNLNNTCEAELELDPKGKVTTGIKPNLNSTYAATVQSHVPTKNLNISNILQRINYIKKLKDAGIFYPAPQK